MAAKPRRSPLAVDPLELILNTNEQAIPTSRKSDARYSISTSAPSIDSKSYTCRTPSIRHQLQANGQRSINEFYAGAMKTKPARTDGCVVKGMQNYSNVVLGDYRLAQETESVGMAMLNNVPTVKDPNEEQNSRGAWKRFNDMSDDGRAVEYKECRERVGDEKLGFMERQMRDKLQQRTQSGPFQLRKNFHYFDQGNQGAISLKAFGRALEFMGFEMTYDEMVALFGLYDVDCSGTIEFYEFVDKLMEQDFQCIAKSRHAKSLRAMADFAVTGSIRGSDGFSQGMDSSARSATSSPDPSNPKDITAAEEHRIRRVFDLIDRSHDGCIDRAEFGLLMAGLGHHQLTSQQLNNALDAIDGDHTGTIEFEEFLRWWRMALSAGMQADGASL